MREAKDNSANTVFVVGTKADSKKGPNAENIAKENSCQYFEASAKTGDGISEIIQRAIA